MNSHTSPFDESEGESSRNSGGGGSKGRGGTTRGRRPSPKDAPGTSTTTGGQQRQQQREQSQQQHNRPDPSPTAADGGGNNDNSGGNKNNNSSKPPPPRGKAGGVASSSSSSSSSAPDAAASSNPSPASATVAAASAPSSGGGRTSPHQPQPQQQQQAIPSRPVHHSLHQPHGASAIGPSPSTVSSTAGSSTVPQYYQQYQGPGGGGGGVPVVSLESPLPPMVQRGLGDRSNDKRKNAALEIEALVKSLQEAHNFGMVSSIVHVLSKDFCTSMNSNYRKGGLVGLAATAIGLGPHMAQGGNRFLELLLPPILHCFDDPEARVRYYACESLYNVAKVSRQSVLAYFNPIFEGLAKLFADGKLKIGRKILLSFITYSHRFASPFL